MQPQLFREYDIEKFKEKDGVVCPFCETRFVARPKTLDDRLVSLLYRALDFTLCKHRKTFRFDEITQDHNELCDMQKLKYWGIIKKSNTPTFWKVTDTGFQFAIGARELSKRVWVVGNRVIGQDEEMIKVEEAPARWQKELSAYTLDRQPLTLSQYREATTQRLI